MFTWLLRALADWRRPSSVSLCDICVSLPPLPRCTFHVYAAHFCKAQKNQETGKHAGTHNGNKAKCQAKREKKAIIPHAHGEREPEGGWRERERERHLLVVFTLSSQGCQVPLKQTCCRTLSLPHTHTHLCWLNNGRWDEGERFSRLPLSTREKISVQRLKLKREIINFKFVLLQLLPLPVVLPVKDK